MDLVFKVILVIVMIVLVLRLLNYVLNSKVSGEDLKEISKQEYEVVSLEEEDEEEEEEEEKLKKNSYKIKNIKKYYENGVLKADYNTINIPDTDDEDEYETSLHGNLSMFYENGKTRLKCIYEEQKLSFLEEYHLNGNLLRKGKIKDDKEFGDWEYYHFDTGNKISKTEYEENWYDSIPEQYKYFKDKLEDDKNGVKVFYQLIESSVDVYKDGEIIDDAYQYEIYENIWDEDIQDYEREDLQGACLIYNEEYDEVDIDDEQELERYSDIVFSAQHINRLSDDDSDDFFWIWVSLNYGMAD